MQNSLSSLLFVWVANVPDYWACWDGGRLAKLSGKLIANRVTAAISVIADTGNHDQAQAAKP